MLRTRPVGWSSCPQQGPSFLLRPAPVSRAVRGLCPCCFPSFILLLFPLFLLLPRLRDQSGHFLCARRVEQDYPHNASVYKSATQPPVSQAPPTLEDSRTQGAKGAPCILFIFNEQKIESVLSCLINTCRVSVAD